MLLSYSNQVKSFNIHRQKRYRKEEICSGTKETLQKVYSCPEDYPTFLDRNKRMNCSSFPQCNGQGLFYHCVKFEDKPAEVCAPRSVITGECCALYDEGLGRVIEDYNRPCSDCPFQYLSDAFLKDSQCVITTETDLPNQPPKETTTVTSKLHLLTVNHLTNASKMSVIGSAKTTIKPCSRKMKRGKRDTACKSGSNHDSAHEDEIPVSSSDKMFKHAKPTPETNSDVMKYYLTIPTGVVFIVILFAAICQYKRKRIKKWFTSEGVVIIKNHGEKNRTKQTKWLLHFSKPAALSVDECTEFHTEMVS